VESVMHLCADLAYRDATVPLAGRLVAFTLDGRNAGASLTAASGRACIDAAAPSAAGTVHVAAHFAGDSSFYESDASALLTIWAPQRIFALRAQPPPSRYSGLFPALNPPPGRPLSQPDTSSQAQASEEVQAQAQSNAQSQAASQSQLQPGVMVQRQRQQQVATQTSLLPQAERGPLATRLALQSRSATVQLVVAALLLGLGLAVRRPAVQLARWRRRPGR
jgi:hypothetical protein